MNRGDIGFAVASVVVAVALGWYVRELKAEDCVGLVHSNRKLCEALGGELDLDDRGMGVCLWVSETAEVEGGDYHNISEAELSALGPLECPCAPELGEDW